jgi:hypothetical protein
MIIIAMMVSFSTVLIFCLLGYEESSRKKGHKGTSNRVYHTNPFFGSYNVLLGYINLKN